MKNSLAEAFKGYGELVQAILGNHRMLDEQLGALVIPTLSRDKRIEYLPMVIEQLERKGEFVQLITETRAAFPDRYHTYDDFWTKESVRNFFRRSGFYLDVFEGKSINSKGAFEKYVAAFQEDQAQATYLTLLEGVKFASPTSGMNFNTFQIRRFSAEELADIAGNQVNQIFYPWAVIHAKRLHDYWFLSITRPEPRSHPIRTLDTLDWTMVNRVKPEYQSATEECRFGSPHQILALFAWEDWDEIEFGRGPCDLPRVLCFDDDLLSSPPAASNLSGLQMGIWVDPETGEESEYRETWIRLDEDGTDQFKTFVQRMEHLFGVLRPQAWGWEFLEIALAYYMKALQSTGLEQLLWYITAIEALVGEERKGVTGRLTKMIRVILGSTKRDRNEIRDQFGELYKFRCDLVHGNKFERELLVNHLATARNFARKTLLWFLHYLYTVQLSIGGTPEKDHILSRDQLLALLDGDPNARQAFRWLTDVLPPGFSYVEEWIE